MPFIAKSTIANQFPQIPSLFSQIKDIPELELENEVGFKNIYLADNPETETGKQIIQNSKTIILIGDIHQTAEGNLSKQKIKETLEYGFKVEQTENYKVEKTQLEILKNKFNINFVGIEGWAGHKIDTQRKRKIINGEIFLVKDLTSNPNYNLVGLENEQIQIKSLDISFHLPLYLQYVNFYSRLRHHFKDNPNKKLIPNFFNELEILIFNSKSNFYGNISKNEYIRIYLNHFKKSDLTQEILNFFQLVVKNLIQTRETYESFNMIDVSKKSVDKHRLYLYKLYGSKQDNYKKIIDEFSPTLSGVRSRFAANTFLEQMTVQNQQIGVIVFGKLHLAEIQSELIKQTNGKINIYIAK